MVEEGDPAARIIDISNSENPAVVGQYDTPEYANAVYVSDNRAFVADGNGGLQVIDISDPAQPEILGSIETSYAYNVYVRNDTIYVSDRDMGLVIIVEEQ